MVKSVSVGAKTILQTIHHHYRGFVLKQGRSRLGSADEVSRLGDYCMVFIARDFRFQIGGKDGRAADGAAAYFLPFRNLSVKIVDGKDSQIFILCEYARDEAKGNNRNNSVISHSA